MILVEKLVAKDQKDLSQTIGVNIFLISFSMLFATMFLAYFLFRGSSDVWPPMGLPRIPLTLPTISTVVIFLSSFLHIFLEKSIEKQLKTKTIVELKAKVKGQYWQVVTTGILFLISQLFLWRELRENGLYVATGVFASILHSFTWVHAGHMVVAVASYFIMWFWRLKTLSTTQFLARVQVVGKFWHFLTLIWFLMFLALFVF